MVQLNTDPKFGTAPEDFDDDPWDTEGMLTKSTFWPKLKVGDELEVQDDELDENGFYKSENGQVLKGKIVGWNANTQRGRVMYIQTGEKVGIWMDALTTTYRVIKVTREGKEVNP